MYAASALLGSLRRSTPTSRCGWAISAHIARLAPSNVPISMTDCGPRCRRNCSYHSACQRDLSSNMRSGVDGKPRISARHTNSMPPSRKVSGWIQTSTDALLRLEHRDGFGNRVLRAHLVEDARELALLVHDECRANDAHELPPVERLLTPHAPRLRDLVVGVGEQRELQPVLVGELQLLLDRVGADADHGGLQLLQLWERVLQVARLLRAPRGVGLRVEVHDDALPLEARQAHELAVLVLQRECRRLVADRERGHGPTPS